MDLWGSSLGGQLRKAGISPTAEVVGLPGAFLSSLPWWVAQKSRICCTAAVTGVPWDFLSC